MNLGSHASPHKCTQPLQTCAPGKYSWMLPQSQWKLHVFLRWLSANLTGLKQTQKAGQTLFLDVFVKVSLEEARI